MGGRAQISAAILVARPRRSFLNMSKASRTFTLTKDGKLVPHLSSAPPKKTLIEVLSSRRLVSEDKATILNSTQPENTVDSRLLCSFPSCIYEAYQHHLNLVLRPDDIWLGIMTVFANYLTFHTKELEQFFQPCDVTAISAVEDYERKSMSTWMELISNLMKHTPMAEESKDWIVPNFSTTTDQDRAVAKLCFLGGMQKFARYGFVGSCGLPQVTLEGTLDDWTELQLKTTMLHQYGEKTGLVELCWWNDILQGILLEFVNSYKGQVNNEFWQSCVHTDSLCGAGIQGWILAFSPWEAEQWRLNEVDIIKASGHYGDFTNYTEFNGPSTVQIEVNFCDKDKIPRTLIIYGGGIVSSFYPETRTIRPNFDLAIFEMPKAAAPTWRHERMHKARSYMRPKLAELQAASGLAPAAKTTLDKHTVHLHQIFQCGKCRKVNKRQEDPRYNDPFIGYHCPMCYVNLCSECVHSTEVVQADRNGPAPKLISVK